MVAKYKIQIKHNKNSTNVSHHCVYTQLPLVRVFYYLVTYMYSGPGDVHVF